MSAARLHANSCFVTSKAEDGYSILIDIILLCITLTVCGQAQTRKVDIIRNIPVESTFGTYSSKRSFSGAIDYLVARVPDAASSGKFMFIFSPIILHSF
jgi:hypothetical protein